MASVSIPSRMVFMDEENPSWSPGQVLIITESVGETSCPVFAVHQNHTYFRPASWNLFVLKEANAAARALKVRECICEGPQRVNRIVDSTCGDFLNEDMTTTHRYAQADPSSDVYQQYPFAFRFDTDQLGLTWNSHSGPPSPSTDVWWESMFYNWSRSYQVMIPDDMLGTLIYATPAVGDYYDFDTWEPQTQEWCEGIDRTCANPILEFVFDTCSTVNNDFDIDLPENPLGFFRGRVGIRYDSTIGPGTFARHFDDALYCAFEQGDSQIDLLKPLTLKRLHTVNTNEWLPLEEQVSSSTIFDWPETLTLTPVY